MIYLIKSYLPFGKYIYKVGFTNNILKRYYQYFYSNPGSEIVSTREGDDFLDNHFYKTNLFHEKMKMYCEFMDQHKNNPEIEEIIFHKISDDRFRKYYNFYGTSGCSARKYREGELYNGMHDKSKEDILKTAILNKFKVGDRYTLKDIKSILSVLYKEHGLISKTPKATDLREYFDLTKTKFYNSETKKKVDGFRLDPL